jgi:agmatinase
MTDIGRIFGGGAVETFLGLPRGELGAAHGGIAILGVPAATPYAATGPYSAAAPAAIRKAVAGYAAARHHMDFDLGGVIGGGGTVPIADYGDVAFDAGDFAGNRQRITAAVSRLRGAGAVPLILGGDDSIPIPVWQAYAGEAPLNILQIDAHIDWRDEIGGERLGLSSNMRRASEMGHIDHIVQAGQRGIGSARPSDAEDARRSGVTFVSARAIARSGIGQVIDPVPAGARVYINLDVDALDPSIMPAVIGPAPGGLTYWQVVEIITAVAARAEIVGFSLVEFVPDRDRDGLAALTAARIAINVLGLLARQAEAAG